MRAFVRYLARHYLELAALFVALGGTAYAAQRVDSGDITNNTLKSADLRDGRAVKGADVAADALTGAQVDETSVALVRRVHRAAATAAVATSGPVPLSGADYTQRGGRANLILGEGKVTIPGGCITPIANITVKADGEAVGMSNSPPVFSGTARISLIGRIPAPPADDPRTLTADAQLTCIGPSPTLTELTLEIVELP